TITPAALHPGDTLASGALSGTANCTGPGSVVVATINTGNDTVIGNTRAYTLTISDGDTTDNLVVQRSSATFTVQDNDRPTQVPTLGALGLGLMGLLLAGLGALTQRRRKA
ncbi:MAG: IPTL-CTERM sorting domain-containing protein, partial [Casimicrobiaceae bacterium]